MVPIFKLLTILNSENVSKVSYNPLMVVFSMVFKEEFKCKANICLHFSFASNEKHANSAWFYNQRYLAGYYPSEILVRVRMYLWACVRMKKWVQRKKKGGVEGGERDNL